MEKAFLPPVCNKLIHFCSQLGSPTPPRDCGAGVGEKEASFKDRLFKTMLYGLGQSEVCKRVTDVWLWQQEGFPPPPPPPPHVTLDGQEFPQSTGDSLLIPGHSQ
ncbi:3-hydroxyanthranilate 3,4-dioxygenase isoform X3 [Salmo trutta]|uniref:3-hydroxyanthranilate 3,4-dioxygenase isoform X3 n=1 Tax=Salmo trutta TaxID=8032 RepID=UPI001131946E|nr:3-hydroxyanthranilate 3,4-dioxygenase-like isoform X3 [Salmo trutta]